MSVALNGDLNRDPPTGYPYGAFISQLLSCSQNHICNGHECRLISFTNGKWTVFKGLIMGPSRIIIPSCYRSPVTAYNELQSFWVACSVKKKSQVLVSSGDKTHQHLLKLRPEPEKLWCRNGPRWSATQPKNLLPPYSNLPLYPHKLQWQ